MNKNTIAFQKEIIVTPNIGVDNRNLAMTVQAELMQFGYMLNNDALTQLGYSDAAEIKQFHKEIIDYLKKMTGGERNYAPIYLGFPQQVMEMSEWELWVNQLVGYFSGGSFKANEWTKTKGTAFEQVEYKMIASGTEEQFQNIFTSLTSVGNSLTPSDLKVIVWFIKEYPFLEFPLLIPFKENLCTVIGTLIREKRDLSTVQLPKLTTTDILRIVVYLSGGDISLPAVPPKKVKINTWKNTWGENPEREKFKFKKFSRPERRLILDLLERSNLDVSEMTLKDQRWIRLGEILHPGEYQHKYPRTALAFHALRNETIISWYGRVQQAFDYSFEVGLKKLSERPGEFVRRLDWLVRTNTDKRIEMIFNTLASIGDKISNKVLFEVYTHFEERAVPKSNRSIMIKGSRKRTQLSDLPALSKKVISTVQSMIFDILKEKFSKLDSLGDCWIDEELKKIPLPTNMRSLNDSLVPTIRGQRNPLGLTKNVIRPFVHWFDERGNRDLDLHGFLVDEHGQMVSFGYNGIHRSDLGCYSGDVRYRQGACAEYIDIDIAKSTRIGFKYFLMVVHNYSGGKLSDIKECVAGTMEREYPEQNKNWKPDTIQNAMLLTNSANMTLIGAYDLETREYIHIDLDWNTFQSSFRRNPNVMTTLAPYISEPNVSVYDLLKWHVEARGRIMNKEIATTHFLFDDFKSSYEKTMEYMGV